jgi:cytochrome c oxidase subunit I
VFLARKLVLAHFWVAFAAFLGAIVLGAWQMSVRSPLSAWVRNPEHYYRSVTAHGTVMAYVLPTLVAMGFGYAISELALKRPLIGLRWAWAGFGLVVGGTLLAAATMAAGKASVLYTFYPPMLASPLYYIGVVLVVVGSWIWVALMSINLHAWRKAHPGETVPLAMFGNVAGAYLWAWTSVGAASELLLQVLPASLGLTDTINAGLARVLFSWTLHAIVYFWLVPAYIAFYTLVPRAIGGRLYSDTMGRVAFALFLVFSMPIGIHHLFADPQVGAGFKFVHSAFTALVAMPTLLTVFTICASVEIAARLRGGRGLFGWVSALPWGNPIMLALAFSFVMLGFGGAGGLINMSYQLDTSIHNTQWITGHFHLIFGGAIVIMYFAIAYDLWPHLTGRPLASLGLMRLQLWLWFVGMIVTTFPWHWVGILGMPRRMAFFDYAAPALNGYALWVGLMIALTVTNYGYPILQLAVRNDTAVQAV